MISYVGNENITAAQLNALTQEADNVLRCLYGDKSPFIYYGGDAFPIGRAVFFGDDALWKIIPIAFPSATVYDHSVYTAAAAAMVTTLPDPYDPVNELIYFEDDPWPIADSLQAHFTMPTDIPFWYAQQIGGNFTGVREKYHRLTTLDVFLEATGGTFTWETEFDKYHFLRFHNFDPDPVTVQLDGSTSIEIPAFGIQAVRRSYPVGSTWTSTYKYLWAAQSGDSLFFTQDSINNVAGFNVFWDLLGDLGAVLDAPNLGFGQRRIYFKSSVGWDGSQYLPQALSESVPTYRYKFHPGRVLSWTSASTTPTATDSTLTWDEFEAGDGAVVWNPATLSVEADTGAATPVDAVGVGTNALPEWPVTLPYTPDTLTASFSTYGIQQSTVTQIEFYYPALPPVVADRIYVSASYENSELTSYTAPHAGASDGLEYTLGEIGALESSSGTELLDPPTVSWTSDGWRMVGHGSQLIPYTYGVAPSGAAIFQCEIGDFGFIHHFGGDIFARSDATTKPLLATRKDIGRKLSDYVGVTDIFDQVSYDGHPDLEGTYGLWGGQDWEESRVEPNESAAKRNIEIPGNATGTFTGTVYPLADPIDTIVSNYETSGWYGTNRTRLLAGNTIKEERQKLVRLPVLRNHYNTTAARWNSVMTIVPYSWDDMIYYGLTGVSDGTWPYVYTVPGYVTAVLPSGSRADEIGITVSFNGSYYVSMADVAAYCATIGIRFFRRHFSKIRQSYFGLQRTRDETSQIYIPSGPGPHWLGRCVAYDDGTGHTLYSETNSQEEILAVEYAEEQGAAPPDGWQHDIQHRILTVPRPVVNYDDDPRANLVTDTLSVYGPTAVDAEAWPVHADFDGEVIDAQDIATLYGETIDPRAPWEVTLINRFCIIRSS